MVNYKIMKAALELGLNYNDIPDMIEMIDSSEVPIAAWGINKETRESKIYVNPKIAKFPIKQIQLVLRHEVLHYAGYKELGILGNKNLENIVLDIAINRILSFPYPDNLKRLCKRIYPPESKNTILALAQAHLQDDADFRATQEGAGKIKTKEDKKILELYHEIWDKDEVPSPLSLYYRLFKGNKDKVKSAWGESGNGKDSDKDKKDKKDSQEAPDSQKSGKGKSKSRTKPKAVFHEIPAEMDTKEPKEKVKDKPLLKEAKSQIDTMKGDCEYKRGRSYSDNRKATEAFSNATSELFNKILVQAKDGIDDKAVGRFIESLNLRREMTDALDPLIREASSSSLRQLYPLKLSRLGIIYIACGISDLIPFYYNRTPENQKLSVAIYIDSSPSMNEFKENEVWLVDKLKESFPTNIFVSSGSVEEVSTKDFALGKYPQGYSTSFDAVVEHFLKQKDDFALVFSDGCSSVSGENQNKFRISRKKLYSIYFSNWNNKVTSSLDSISSSSISLVIKKKERARR